MECLAPSTGYCFAGPTDIDYVTEVENKLYCGNFQEAVKDALQLLTDDKGGCQTDSCRTRCMYVLLQAHFMTRDFDSLDKLMQEFCDIKRFSPQVVVLWVLILLDFQQYDRAKHEVLEYLQVFAPQGALTVVRSSSSSIDLLALARLYAVELVAKTERQYAEARRWLQVDAHFLTTSYLEQLVKEVDSVEKYDYAQQQCGSSCKLSEDDLLCTFTGFPSDLEQDLEAKLCSAPQQDLKGSMKPLTANVGSSRWPWLPGWHLTDSSWGLECLTSTRHKLEQINPYHAAAAAAVGGLLVYALFERGPVSRYLQKQAGRIKQGAAELCGLALAVSTNPAMTNVMRAARV